MKRKLLCIAAALSTLFAAASVQGASVRTPDGNMPLIHWAVVESADGQMGVLQQLGAKHVAPEVAKEDGTYALYGAVDAKNPNIMRVLEFYEDDGAYRIHASSDGFHAYDEARRPYLKGVKILEATGIALEQKDSGVGTSVQMDLIQVKPDAWKPMRSDWPRKSAGPLLTMSTSSDSMRRLKRTIRPESIRWVSLPMKKAIKRISARRPIRPSAAIRRT